MKLLGAFFGSIMSFCYGITGNFGIAIVLFTILTKIILMPLSVVVQKNSIKMVKMYPELNRIKVKFMGNRDMIAEEEYQLYKRENYHPMLDLVPVFIQLIVLMGMVEGIRSIDIADKTFLGIDLGIVPKDVLGIYIWVPMIAALSAWLMCFTQNLSNVLQSEQGKLNKAITMGVSVGLSLYLGFFVESGIGCYWIFSNLMSIGVMYLLNALINPKKYIDYDALEQSRQELNKMTKSLKATEKKVDKVTLDREKSDYKRFLRYESKQLVFYSERNGFYKYYQNVIEYILSKTDIVIHYVTSDPNDEIFAKSSNNFQTYYIGDSKLIVLMMKMDADIVVMTMPDLQKYHIKRSMVRNDIEYIYLDHGIGSDNLMLRKHALDYFDTVFASNDVGYAEVRAQEKTYGLKEKTLVKYGSGLIDNMIANYKANDRGDVKTILIAPSWQEENLIDMCIDEILDNILGIGYRVILRPHPQHVRHCEERLKAIAEKYKDREDFELQLDFSSNSTVFNADMLMTDWSGIVYEYAFTTLKPVIFINTPMKVMNPDYEEIGVKPLDLIIRDSLGISLEIDELGKLPETIKRLESSEEYTPQSMEMMRDKYLYNVGHSTEVGAKYIINRLIEYSRQ